MEAGGPAAAAAAAGLLLPALEGPPEQLPGLGERGPLAAAEIGARCIPGVLHAVYLVEVVEALLQLKGPLASHRGAPLPLGGPLLQQGKEKTVRQQQHAAILGEAADDAAAATQAAGGPLPSPPLPYPWNRFKGAPSYPVRRGPLIAFPSEGAPSCPM